MTVVTMPGRIALADLAAWAGGELRRPRAGDGSPAASVRGASIDTRTLEPGQLFVALPGTRTDGHDFLDQAFAAGASAALCARDRVEARRGREPGALVVVDDVTAALQRVARRHRERWTGLLIGVTGSAGKTTTKDLVGLALAADRPTLVTRGNLNNHWGVPLTLLALEPRHRAAVVELGMNRPGEIALLASLAAPHAAVITLVGPAHLEAFGSVAAVAAEKVALARGLPPGGPVFANADSPALVRALADAPQRVVWYGLSAGAAVRPRRLEPLGERGQRLEVDGFPPCTLGLVGRHQAVNALAAFAVAREYALDPDRTVRAIESYAPARGRMEVRRACGAVLLVDTYNANPDSMRAALEVLAGWPEGARRIALLGDMLELGEAAPTLHREVGAAVRNAELWTVGRHADDLAAGAEAAGIAARRFGDKPAAAAALREALAPGVVVLLKASRGMALEDLLQGLEEG